MKMKPASKFFKVNAVILAMIFLLDQAAWALGAGDMPLNAGSDQADKTTPSYITSSGLEARDSAQNSLIDTKNAIENYGNITPLEDGTRILTNNGCELYLKEDGNISKIVTPEGKTVDFELVSENGEVKGLKIKEDGFEKLYGLDGKLVSTKIVDASGKTTEISYDAGKLSEIKSDSEVLKGITVDALGTISSLSLVKCDGSEYFFRGGTLESFRDNRNAEYIFGGDGKLAWMNLKDTGESYRVTNSYNSAARKEKTVFAEVRTGIAYTYINGLLESVSEASGATATYSYNSQKKVTNLKVRCGGKVNALYTYSYVNGETRIKDDAGTIRTYDTAGEALRLETAYGETYTYTRDKDAAGRDITIVNYSIKKGPSGEMLYYLKGELKKAVMADGSWADNIEFISDTGELSKFTLHDLSGRIFNVSLKEGFTQVELEDSSRLIFKGDKLVALGGSQGIAPIYDGLGLEEIFGPAKSGNAYDASGVFWKPQTYAGSRGIVRIESDFEKGEWTAEFQLASGDKDRSQGEMLLDLRYDVPGCSGQRPLDLRNKEISFELKLDDGFVASDGRPCLVQVFAKDSNWKTQYGAKVELVPGSDRVKATLIPTKDNINRGYADAGFNPAGIVMIGIRILAPDGMAGQSYKGSLQVKPDILPELSFVSTKKNVLDDFYRSLGIERDLGRLYGETASGGTQEKLETFSDALSGGSSLSDEKNILSGVVFHPETKVTHVKGITSSVYDMNSGCYVMSAALCSTGTSNREGEVSFDVRRDVPGLEWDKPMNLTTMPIRMLVEVPEGLAASSTAPNGARIFMVDDKGNKQYGTWVNLKEGGRWYLLELTPTFGTVPMGYTQGGFNPSKIVKIGINIATQSGSKTDFKGDIRFKFYTDPEGRAGEIARPSPLWMDARKVRECLNSIGGSVPFVTQGGTWIEGRALAEKIKNDGTSVLGESKILGSIGRFAAAIPGYKLPTDTAATVVYGSDGKTISISKSDGTTVYMDAQGRPDRAVFNDGSTFLKYEYDADGKLARTLLAGARDKLSSEMSDLTIEVEKRASDALLLLAEEKKIIEESFMEKVTEGRARFAAARASLEEQRYVDVKHNILGCVWTERVKRPGVDAAIADVNRQEAEFEAAVAAELSKLEGMFGPEKDKVLEEKRLVLAEYASYGKNIMDSILRQEALPVINREYRDVLGRDADKSEVEAIFARVSEFRPDTLRAELLASDEYKASAAYKAKVIAYIKSSLGLFTATSGTLSGQRSLSLQKSALLSSLGLKSGDIIKATTAYVNAAVKWLEEQSLHFGRSAFGAMETFLKASGVNADSFKLAGQAILIDLLLGVTVPNVSETLEISMHAMNRVSSLYKVRTTSARLSREDALRLKKPFIALINGNHYVTVLSAGADKVVYWDQNYGKNGGEVTVGAEEFFRGWQGNVITKESIAKTKVLSIAAAKRIKGACFAFVFAVAYGISMAVATAVTAAVTAIVTIAAPLICLVSGIINAVVGGIAAIGEGLKLSAASLLGKMGVGAGGAINATAEVAVGPVVKACAGSTAFGGLSYSAGVLSVSELPTFTLGIPAQTAGGMVASSGLNTAFAPAVGFNAASLAKPLLLGASAISGLAAAGIISLQNFSVLGTTVKLKMTTGEILKASEPDLAHAFVKYGIEVVDADVYSTSELVNVQKKSLGFIEAVTDVEFDDIAGTVKIDMDLAYFDIIHRPFRTAVDSASFGMTANKSWDISTADAARCYDIAVRNSAVKGVSISGINDDGTELDELAKQLAAEANCRVTVVHSAGSDALPKITNVPADMKFIVISPQTGRVGLEAWITKMGLRSDQVLVVDVVNDLPYRPADFVGLTLKDQINPANMNNIGKNSYNIVQRIYNNAYYDKYGDNLNGKYTYMRIKEGPGIDYDLDLMENHRAGVDGALRQSFKYKINYKGETKTRTIKSVYEAFLQGE